MDSSLVRIGKETRIETNLGSGLMNHPLCKVILVLEQMKSNVVA